jgi:hypothetical protein
MRDWRKDYEPGGKLYPLVQELEQAHAKQKKREELGLPREPVPCKSTRYGAGCGHDTMQHIGPNSVNQDCNCCTWRHNA